MSATTNGDARRPAAIIRAAVALGVLGGPDVLACLAAGDVDPLLDVLDDAPPMILEAAAREELARRWPDWRPSDDGRPWPPRDGAA